MTSITDNEAAWIPAELARAEVGPGPQPSPAENEVVIKVAYAAVNPTDWILQDAPYTKFEYPWIFGVDVAGTVVAVGSKVTRFEIGQRVIGHCDSILTQKITHAGFQKYTTCMEILVTGVPDGIPLSKAVVLPLSISTAATALYKHLKLPFPSLEPTAVDKVILIWGGSSSVGSTAIQLAKSSGYTVATTASAHNHDYVKALGADHVFDHTKPNVIDQILKLLKPGDVVFDAIGTEAPQKATAEIISKLGGGILPTTRYLTASGYANVEVANVNGLDPGLVNFDIGKAVWGDYMTPALTAGKFKPAPEPEILKGGLARVQEGIDILRKGVSAKKIVIEIGGEQ